MNASKPIVAFNTKVFPQSVGKAGITLCKAADAAASRFPSVQAIYCPAQSQLELACSTLRDAWAFAQHTDASMDGQSTGWLPPEAVFAAGAAGTLLNHSEHRMAEKDVLTVVQRSIALKLKCLVCAASLEEALGIAVRVKPWAVALEPPELIGTGVSVSTAKPKVVTDFVSHMRSQAPDVIPIVGAGVSTAADVSKCIELGASGVLLASAFAKSRDPYKTACQLLEAATSSTARLSPAGQGRSR
jgi:triosephosphate isomerase